MSRSGDREQYALLMPIDPKGQMAPMDAQDTSWRLALARPATGSLTERELNDVQDFDTAAGAIGAFFTLMKSGLQGVIDSPHLRVYGPSPEAILDDLTEAIHEACDAIPEEDQRDDDWDNCEFTELREGCAGRPSSGG